MGRHAFIPGIIAAAALLSSFPAQAQSLPLGLWLKECGTAESLPLTLNHEYPQLAVIGVKPYAIEMTVPPNRAFVDVNGVGLSPVGEFPEWARAPKELHTALAGLMRCAERFGPPNFSGTDVLSRSTVPVKRSNHPWRLLVGLLIAAFALAPLLRRHERVHALDLAAVALVPITLLGRALLVPVAYLHQNGQGPLWVSYALGEPSGYGPGFRQLHLWLLDRVADPDGTLFLVHAVTGALVPLLLYVVARATSAGRPAALALAIAVAASPTLSRAAQSEHYFASIIVLLTLAGTLLAATASPEGGWRRFRLGVLAAGFLVAQAAMVHPIGWLPAALLPVCVFFVPGDVTTRAIRAAGATAGIGAVVALTTGPQLYDVLQGELARQWMAPGMTSLGSFDAVWLTLAAVAVAVGIAVRPLRPLAVPLAVAMLAWATFDASSKVLMHSTPTIRGAYGFLFVPVIISALAAAFAPLRSRTSAVAAAVSLALALGVHIRNWDSRTELPTDSLEGKLALEWRTLVPKDSRVIAVERAKGFVLSLPLRPPDYRRGSLFLPPAGETLELPSLTGDDFYYRGALCSTTEARAFCEAIENTHQLERVWSATLPARPSLEHQHYDTPDVEVVLFRVVGPAAKSGETPREDSESPPAAAIE